jgi:hypothetical protein
LNEAQEDHECSSLYIYKWRSRDMFCTNLNNHVPLMIPVNYCTCIDSSQKYLVYSIETHIKIYSHCQDP